MQCTVFVAALGAVHLPFACHAVPLQNPARRAAYRLNALSGLPLRLFVARSELLPAHDGHLLALK